MTKDPTRRDRLAIAFAIVFPSFFTLLYFVVLAGAPTGLQQVVFWAGKTLQFAFPVAWVVVAQRRKIHFSRPRRQGMFSALAFGVFVVAGMFTMYFVVLKPYGLFEMASLKIQAKVQNFGVDSWATFLALGLFYSLMHSFLEEYYWRWYVFDQLLNQGRLAMAIVLSSIGFMAHHVIVLGFYFGWNSSLTYFFSVSVAVGGLAWAWLYYRAKSIYAPWFSHMIVDAGIFVLGYDVIRNRL